MSYLNNITNSQIRPTAPSFKAKIEQHKEIISNVRDIGSDQWTDRGTWNNKMISSIKAEYSVSLKGYHKDRSLTFQQHSQCFNESNIAHNKINTYRSEIYKNLRSTCSDVLALKYYRSPISKSELGSSAEEDAIAISIEKNSKLTDKNNELFLKIDQEISTYKGRIKDITGKDYSSIINSAVALNDVGNTGTIPTVAFSGDISIIVPTEAASSAREVFVEQASSRVVREDSPVVSPADVHEVTREKAGVTEPLQDVLLSSSIASDNIKESNKVFAFDSGVNKKDLAPLDKELFDLIARAGQELDIDRGDSKNSYVIDEMSFNTAKLIHQNVVDSKLLNNDQLKKMDRVGFSFATSRDGSSNKWEQWISEHVHDTEILNRKGEFARHLSFINTAYLNGEQRVEEDGGFHESVGALMYGSSITDRTVGTSLLKLKERYGLIDTEKALNILKDLVINQIKQKSSSISDEQIKINAKSKSPRYLTNDLYAAYRGLNQAGLNLNYVDKVEGRVSTKEAIAYLLKAFIDVKEITALRKDNNLNTSPAELFAHQKDNIKELVERLGHVQRAGNRNNRDIALDTDDQMPDRGVCAHGTFNQVVEIGNLKHKDINIMTSAKALFDSRLNTLTKKHWKELSNEQQIHLQDLFKENNDVKIHKTNEAYYIKNNSQNIDKSYNEFIMKITKEMDSEFNFFNSKSPYYLGIPISMLEANINNLQYLDF